MSKDNEKEKMFNKISNLHHGISFREWQNIVNEKQIHNNITTVIMNSVVALIFMTFSLTYPLFLILVLLLCYAVYYDIKQIKECKKAIQTNTEYMEDAYNRIKILRQEFKTLYKKENK